MSNLVQVHLAALLADSERLCAALDEFEDTNRIQLVCGDVLQRVQKQQIEQLEEAKKKKKKKATTAGDKEGGEDNDGDGDEFVRMPSKTEIEPLPDEDDDEEEEAVQAAQDTKLE